MRFPVVSKLGTVFGFCALACNAQPAESTPSEPPAVVAPAAKKAVAPTPVVTDTSFQLTLESQPTYTSGEAGTVKLLISPRGGYHVNLDYPVRIDFSGPEAIKLVKANLGKPDAAEFSEERARFEVGFTAEAGSHELLADVDFAVCTKETCLPEQRTLAVVLNVQ